MVVSEGVDIQVGAARLPLFYLAQSRLQQPRHLPAHPCLSTVPQ